MWRAVADAGGNKQRERREADTTWNEASPSRVSCVAPGSPLRSLVSASSCVQWAARREGRQLTVRSGSGRGSWSLAGEARGRSTARHGPRQLWASPSCVPPSCMPHALSLPYSSELFNLDAHFPK